MIRSLSLLALTGLCCCTSYGDPTLAAGGDSTPTAYDPTSAYIVEDIAGWTVHFHRRLLKDQPELAGRVRQELLKQLTAIKSSVPTDKVRKLQRSKIWVERFHPMFPCACYHPSAQWLRENGFNPDKVDSVDISNPDNFLEWSQQQPWMLLHELAHGYHDQVLGHGHRAIRQAYEKAKSGETYREVKHIDGRTVSHYALSNDQEYFAETTEAYFGKNDFYPFVRNDLEQFDPEGFALMRAIWGD